MKTQQPTDFFKARQMLLDAVAPLGTERVPLFDCGGRVLARPLYAAEDVPPFDRSPYDGYAFRAADTAGAGRETPVTLEIVEEIAAGSVPAREITPGSAAKVLTGAPIPPGADAVVKFEDTEFTAETVTLFAPAKPGGNVVRCGEDVKAGTLLLDAGRAIDPGAAGALAAQGVAAPEVYRVPRVAVFSTGSELAEAGEAVGAGKIRDSNAVTLAAALRRAGFVPAYYGIAGDSAAAIRAKLDAALGDCDAVVCTGGVSVGDYDLTLEAMEHAGVGLLFRGVKLKPGMACAYGVKDGKPVCALSGNPASSLTNYYVLALPALRKLAGYAAPLPKELTVRLRAGFPKASKAARYLRGSLAFGGGLPEMLLPPDQGNVVLSSAIGNDAMALVPAGSGPLAAGTELKGFLL